jgi:hypothetical protein
MSRVHTLSAILLITGLTLASRAWAQDSGYVAASGFAEIRQFGSSAIPYLLVPSDGSSLDTTGAGGGLRVGTFLHRRWSLELSADAGSRTEIEVENPVVILIFPPPPRSFVRASTSFLTVGTLVGFHPPAIGRRVRLAYRAGFSFVRGTYKTNYPNFIYPAALGSISALPTTGGLPTYSQLDSIFAPARIAALQTTQKHNAAGLTLGFDAAIDMTRGLALVPEVRAFVFSTPGNGPTAFLFRPGVGIRWKF